MCLLPLLWSSIFPGHLHQARSIQYRRFPQHLQQSGGPNHSRLHYHCELIFFQLHLVCLLPIFLPNIFPGHSRHIRSTQYRNSRMHLQQFADSYRLFLCYHCELIFFQLSLVCLKLIFLPSISHNRPRQIRTTPRKSSLYHLQQFGDSGHLLFHYLCGWRPF